MEVLHFHIIIVVMNFIMVEDHKLVRQGVTKIIEEKSDFKCVGSFASVSETKNFLSEYSSQADGPTPLLCIVDINLGGSDPQDGDGLSLIRFIKENYKNIYCICYSMFKGAGIVEQAVSAGAVGYVSKNADLEVLLDAMEKADKGKFFMEESLTSDYVVYTNLYNSLTKREKELAGLFFQNKNEEQIAELMGITPRAVDNYMTRILSKLGVMNKKELIKKFGDV
jgi:two-component system uhpT operon response regulator UhpA